MLVTNMPISWFNKYKLYLFPRSDGKDTLNGILKNVKHFEMTSNDKAFIGLITPRWRNGRLGIAKTIRKIYKNGAFVAVNVRDAINSDTQDEEFDTKIRKIIGLNFFNVLHGNYRGGISSLFHENRNTNIHTKTLLIDAPYKVNDEYIHQKNIWIGSMNLTKPSIKDHWESILKIENDEQAFKIFLDNFNYLQREASHLDVAYQLRKMLWNI